MKTWVSVCAALLCLCACQQSNEIETPHDAPDLNVTVDADRASPQSMSEIEQDKTGLQEIQSDLTYDDVRFEDVLAQFQSLNARLERVSYVIQKSNAELCSHTVRNPGFTVHNIFDYPENLQPVAGVLLSVSEKLSIRTVKENSPAYKAGLQSGDELIQISGQYLPSGRTAKTLYAALSESIFRQNAFDVKIRRQGETLTFTLMPETLCGYPVNLFFSERVNGHTDGEEVWITSELLRSRPDDVDLALVIAHEMSHAIAGHADLASTKSLELIADKMALIMLARAGLNYERAIENWQRTPHGPDDLDEQFPDRASTHPSKEERLENFKRAQGYIETRKASGKRLELN